MQTEILRVTGMRSASCADAIAKALDTVDGVDDFSIALAAGSVTIRYDERRTSSKEFQAALTAAGYPCRQPAHARRQRHAAANRRIGLRNAGPHATAAARLLSLLDLRNHPNEYVMEYQQSS